MRRYTGRKKGRSQSRKVNVRKHRRYSGSVLNELGKSYLDDDSVVPSDHIFHKDSKMWDMVDFNNVHEQYDYEGIVGVDSAIPRYVFHGTSEEYVESILDKGLSGDRESWGLGMDTSDGVFLTPFRHEAEIYADNGGLLRIDLLKVKNTGADIFLTDDILEHEAGIIQNKQLMEFAEDNIEGWEDMSIDDIRDKAYNMDFDESESLESEQISFTEFKVSSVPSDAIEVVD